MPENIKDYKYQRIGNDLQIRENKNFASRNYICPGGIGFAG